MLRCLNKPTTKEHSTSPGGAYLCLEAVVDVLRAGGAEHLAAPDLVFLHALEQHAHLVAGLSLLQHLVEHLDACRWRALTSHVCQ